MLISAIAVIPSISTRLASASTAIVFSSENTLFTPNTDVVDFNHLTSAQKLDIQEGSQIYDGLGASDNVVLPSVANYNESVGGSKTLGWIGTNASLFHTDSEAGDTYTVSGSDGNYYIAGGAGSDTIVISGKGSSYIALGDGSESVTIRGGGYMQVAGNSLISATIGSKSVLELIQSDQR